MRAVVDPGVLISGLLVAGGPPGRIIDLWREGAFDLVVSASLLDELVDALNRPRLASRVGRDEVGELLDSLRRSAVVVDDPPVERGVTPDPDDDYLVSLARASRADVLVSGDRHLTGLVDVEPPVLTPRAFASLLDESA